jgi:regulator of cell morphogenesis and NO signaling
MEYTAATMTGLGRNLQQWKSLSNKEIIEFVLERYHSVHRSQLPEAVQLARRVEQAHSGSADCPNGLSEHLSIMYQELESHMMKEEQILFPMLINESYPQGPIMVMENEHEEHEVALQRILHLTNNLILPESACGTWRALYKLLNEFIQDVRAHIDLESQVLFIPNEQLSGKCCGSCGG